jgi:hypothetical protein
MTAQEIRLMDYLIAYGKTENQVKAIEDAATHVHLSYLETNSMIRNLERREEVFFETDPARDVVEEPLPRITTTRCWWQMAKPHGVAPCVE